MSAIPDDAKLSIPSWSTEGIVRGLTWTWPEAADDTVLSPSESSSEEKLIAWGISKIKEKSISSNGTGIDIISGQLEWHPRVDDNLIEDLLKKSSFGQSKGSQYMDFTIDEYAEYRQFHQYPAISTWKIALQFQYPRFYYSCTARESSYWAKIGNQQSVVRNSASDVEVLELCYQYRAGWKRPENISYIHARHDQNGATYFCVNYPPKAFEIFKAVLKTANTESFDLSQLDNFAAAESLSQWQQDLGSIRKRMIIKEQLLNAETIDIDFSGETRALHQLSKEFLALREDLVAFHTQLKYLRDAFDIVLSAKTPTLVNNTNPFDVLISQAEICARWPVVYRERINICIQLLFHFSNQRIATSSHQIAEQAQRDSASMITIAAVTMVFLPGTFISAILSTTFFDFGEQTLQVSSKWWALLATTVPLTIVVFGFWYWWRWQGLAQKGSGKRLLDVLRRYPVEKPVNA